MASTSNLSPGLQPHPSAASLTKRCLDILGSIAGLAILAVIAPAIAIAIKLDSPGPVFYRQVRVGYHGQRFTMYKFRSMVQNADDLKQSVTNEADGLIFKNKHDPRITRVGKFLRQTSLDEFPQFWHVLRGQMSLVGTRPPTPDEVEQYSDRHWQRLQVKPGLTGEWQAHGRSRIKDFEQILAMDLRYQEVWTPLYDLVLLWKTVATLLDREASH